MTSVRIIDILQKYIVKGPTGEYRATRHLVGKKNSHFRWVDLTGDSK